MTKDSVTVTVDWSEIAKLRPVSAAVTAVQSSAGGDVVLMFGHPILPVPSNEEEERKLEGGKVTPVHGAVIALSTPAALALADQIQGAVSSRKESK